MSNPTVLNQTFPLTLNADGSINSQTNPAAPGSRVTIFIDGLGVTSPVPVTGLVSTSLPAALNLPLTVIPNCSGTFCYPSPSFVSAGPAVGSISGVTQVQLLAPANPNPGVEVEFQVIFSLSAGATTVRDMNLSFWVN